MLETVPFDPSALILVLAAEIAQLTSASWWHSHIDELLKVILIDITLAGDNAIVVGMAASRVERSQRTKVIFWGISAAVVLRILFAGITQQLLAIVGLMLAGGILLLWVCWKMYRQLIEGDAFSMGETAAGTVAVVGFWTAVWHIIIADVSMSLDNVLAVAGAAGESKLVLVIGLGLAIVLMAVASHFIAGLLARYPAISWIGLAIIVWVALDMIYRGTHEVTCKAGVIGCQEPLFRALMHGIGIGP